MKYTSLLFIVVLISAAFAINVEVQSNMQVENLLKSGSSTNANQGPCRQQEVAPAETVAPAVTQHVTCWFTVDNAVDSVTYNGQPLEISGDLNSWNVDKTVSFDADSCNPGTIEVQGLNSEGPGSDACVTGGFKMVCETQPKDTDDNLYAYSPWNSFKSNTQHWIGTPDGGQAYLGYGEAVPTPCVSTSGFNLQKPTSAEKIWCSSGAYDCVLAGTPPPSVYPGQDALYKHCREVLGGTPDDAPEEAPGVAEVALPCFEILGRSAGRVPDCPDPPVAPPFELLRASLVPRPAPQGALRRGVSSEGSKAPPLQFGGPFVLCIWHTRLDKLEVPLFATVIKPMHWCT